MEKGGILTEAHDAVMSYCCDRSRSVTWGIFGGLPSTPHGVELQRSGQESEFLGTIFSNVKVGKGDYFTRPSAGGGGLGDPLERDPKSVLEDVIDEYVSIERAEKDYGVVIKEIDREIDLFEIDAEATENARELIRLNRQKWLEENPETVMEKFRKGEVDLLDLIRRYGIIIDQQTGEYLPKTTDQNREAMRKRTLEYWK